MYILYTMYILKIYAVQLYIQDLSRFLQKDVLSRC